jgi:phage shock protein C
MSDRFSPRGLYRSRSGRLLGVCKGLAGYFDISVFWTRVVVVLLAFCTAFWPVAGLYVLMALLMKREPLFDASDDAEREFYNSYAASPRLGVERLKRRFDAVDKRVRRMEDIVTAKDFDWQRRFERG